MSPEAHHFPWPTGNKPHETRSYISTLKAPGEKKKEKRKEDKKKKAKKKNR